MSLSNLILSQSILTSQSDDNLCLTFLFLLISCKQNLVVFNLKYWIKKSFPKIVFALSFVILAYFCFTGLVWGYVSPILPSPPTPSSALELSRKVADHPTLKYHWKKKLFDTYWCCITVSPKSGRHHFV